MFLGCLTTFYRIFDVYDFKRVRGRSWLELRCSSRISLEGVRISMRILDESKLVFWPTTK